jgi:hypothetical protein
MSNAVDGFGFFWGQNPPSSTFVFRFPLPQIASFFCAGSQGISEVVVVQCITLYGACFFVEIILQDLVLCATNSWFCWDYICNVISDG